MVERIHNHLMGWFSTGHRAANIFVPDWWECDVVRVTDSDWWDEVEIKTSVADFKADARKTRTFWKRGTPSRQENKHDQIASGDPTAPNRFWFAMPKALAEKITLPLWAGCFTWERMDDGRIGRIRMPKRAPVIHRHKNGDRVRQHLFRSIYFRYAEDFRRRKPEVFQGGLGI